jgi:hypothetical protein
MQSGIGIKSDLDGVHVRSKAPTGAVKLAECIPEDPFEMEI